METKGAAGHAAKLQRRTLALALLACPALTPGFDARSVARWTPRATGPTSSAVSTAARAFAGAVLLPPDLPDWDKDLEDDADESSGYVDSIFGPGPIRRGDDEDYDRREPSFVSYLLDARELNARFLPSSLDRLRYTVAPDAQYGCVFTLSSLFGARLDVPCATPRARARAAWRARAARLSARQRSRAPARRACRAPSRRRAGVVRVAGGGCVARGGGHRAHSAAHEPRAAAPLLCAAAHDPEADARVRAARTAVQVRAGEGEGEGGGVGACVGLGVGYG
jgi:hypothetical protein